MIIRVNILYTCVYSLCLLPNGLHGAFHLLKNWKSQLKNSLLHSRHCDNNAEDVLKTISYLLVPWDRPVHQPDTPVVRASKKQIQRRTCHGTLTELPLSRMITNLDALAFRMSLFNPVIELKPGDTILFTEKGEPLWNIRVLPDGTYELFGKVGGHRFQFHPVKGSGCTQNPAQQDSASCHQCHSVER